MAPVGGLQRMLSFSRKRASQNRTSHVTALRSTGSLATGDERFVLRISYELRFLRGQSAFAALLLCSRGRPSLGPLLHCLSSSATLVDTNGLCRAVPGTARAGRTTRRRRLWLNARNAAVRARSPVRNARARETCPVRRRVTPPLPRGPLKACVRDAMAAEHRIARVATARERFTRDRRIEEALVVRIT